MNDVKLGDIVYIHGYYTADTTVPPTIITAKVYRRYNKSVFEDMESAKKSLNEKIANKSWL